MTTTTFKPIHFVENYLLNPEHQITVNLIGCGGTGSQMLANLASLNSALIALGHPGLSVTAWDGDEITEANIGRQLFSPADVGNNKAVVLISRINRFYGFRWNAEPQMYGLHGQENLSANLIVSCVDSAKARELIGKRLPKSRSNGQQYRGQKCFYWLDLGNGKTSGQVVLGTVKEIKQPTSEKWKPVGKLPTVLQRFPDLKKYETADQGPSCSLAEAIGRQDLYINRAIALYGSDLLWKMFRQAKLETCGVFVNLETQETNPIRVQQTIKFEIASKPIRKSKKKKASRK